ncbi:MAG TPA: HYR domain-containing protein, partial [Chitinophagaceae bacterium]
LPTVTDNCGLPGPLSLTQTASQVPVAGSVACNSGGFHTLNSYWRAYNLAPLALPGPVQINSVQFGIELADANGSGTTQPVTVNVYTSAGAFPGGVRTLVGTSGVIQIPDQTLSTFTANITVPPTVPANAILVLELQTPDGRAPANNRFFIGSNSSAQTGPSYISAPDCGIATPTNLATLGFPNMHIILNANGVITGPSPLTQIAGLPSGATYPVGVTTNTFRATDIAGNTSTCSFTVTVVDNQAPAVTCPANIVANTDAGVCIATVATPNPTTSDNCGVVSVTWAMTGATVASSPATGINYVGTMAFNLNGTTGQGITTVTYTVKDAAGNTTTCSFTVTVNDASIPVISGQPSNQFVCVGSNGAFTVTATAGAGNPLTYQWQAWNGSAWVNIAGATAATLPLPGVTFSMNTNSYRVILTGRCSVVTSAFATLYVNPLPTVSLLASRPLALLPGQLLTITAVASPGGGSYQWRKNGVVMAATGSSLTNLSVDDIGSYTVTYTDLNGCKATSAAMVVSGQPSDKIWVYPNPNAGVFQVRFFNAANEPVNLNIFNSAGQKVYTKAVITNLSYTEIDVDLNKVPAGTYLVEVINSTGKIIGAKKVSVNIPQ